MEVKKVEEVKQFSERIKTVKLRADELRLLRRSEHTERRAPHLLAHRHYKPHSFAMAIPRSRILDLIKVCDFLTL